MFWLSIGGPAIGAAVFAFFDQAVRNTVDTWMGGRDLFEHIALSETQYNELPLQWRRTLAEVVMRPEGEALDAKRVVETATVEDLELIGRLAPYQVSGHLARDERFKSEHPIPGVTYEDMRRLEEIGIVDDVNSGVVFTFESDGKNRGGMRIWGSTILIEATNETDEFKTKVQLTRLTVAGKMLLSSLQSPSNVPYFEWIAKKLEKEGWSVQMMALGTKPGEDMSTLNEQGVIDRMSIASWATNLPTK